MLDEHLSPMDFMHFKYDMNWTLPSDKRRAIYDIEINQVWGD